MLDFLRKIFRRPPESTPNAKQRSGHTHTLDLEPLLLERFLKPRRLDKAAPGWPDKILKPALRAITARGDIVRASLPSQIDVAMRVVDIKAALKERGLPVSGTKPILIQRLIESGFSAGDHNAPDVYECSASGKLKADEWTRQREEALEQSINRAMDYLRERRIDQAIEVVDAARAAWPTVESIAVQFNPMTISGDQDRQARRIEIILAARPGILGDLTEDDLSRLQMAVALWQLGIPDPGMQIAMTGYVGVERFDARRAPMLLLYYAQNIQAVEGMRGGLIKEATVSFVDPCAECAKLDGMRFPVEKLPELPNPYCVAEGCIFLVSSIIPGLDD